MYAHALLGIKVQRADGLA